FTIRIGPAAADADADVRIRKIDFDPKQFVRRILSRFAVKGDSGVWLFAGKICTRGHGKKHQQQRNGHCASSATHARKYSRATARPTRPWHTESVGVSPMIPLQ